MSQFLLRIYALQKPFHDLLFLKFRRSSNSPPLKYLLRSLCDYQETDPRDKIFALLGIAGDAKIQGIFPNYRKACEDVYTDLARTLIQNCFIELLSLCEFPKKVDGLPCRQHLFWSPNAWLDLLQSMQAPLIQDWRAVFRCLQMGL